MVNITYKINGDYIELYKLLKINRAASTGGHAKILIENGEIMLNGNVEHRKRAKICAGDIVETNQLRINVE